MGQVEDGGATRSLQESCLMSPNRALRQVIHFAGVRRFGEAQVFFKSGSPTT